MKKTTSKWISGGVLLLLGLIYLILKIKYHDLWKDEWQPWLLARDKSLPDLIQFLHLEGHPSLWFLFLKPLALISNVTNFSPTQQVLLFKLAHGMLFLGALFVLLFRFKMPILIRIGMACGFYFFYQYGVVNRGYMLLILLSFLLVSLLKEKGKIDIKMGILLFLLCQTEVYGVFIAVSLFICFWFDYYQKENSLAFLKNKTMKWVGIAALSGVFTFVLTVYPRGNHNVVGLNTDGSLIDNLGHALQGNFANTFWIGLIPDTNVFGYSVFGVSCTLVLIGLFIFFFLRDKSLLLAFLTYMLGAVLFGTFIYQGGVRHWGIGFIFFAILTELYFRRNGALSRFQIGLVTSFLLCQLYYNALAISKEVKYQFSNALVTAEFIKREVPETAIIVAINKFETAPVVAYLGRKVYALPDGNPFTYYQWLDQVYFPPESELRTFAAYKKRAGLIVLSPKPLDKNRYPNVRIWKNFENYNMKNENYYLYLLDAE